ncbi:unnamed protein product [Adineta steineri]|uniref:Uncharacterized protein n=1 Tax=Adineta steineri TaxID=433720 RepID=A0A814I1D5_9BILA|nr:unnamed protein product [Adineta steineri]CAF3556902.1 unnamed protein product [Adineta steineri]
MTKRGQTDSHSVSHMTTFINDLWTSHQTLAPNEYSLSTIGIQSFLVRYVENELFVKYIYPVLNNGLKPKDFLNGLNNMEKAIEKKYQISIERYIVVARLRKYLEENENRFQDILNEIQIHLQQCMSEHSYTSELETLDIYQQFEKRNQAALKLHYTYRMRRFQFYNGSNIGQPINSITLQKWIQTHFQLFLRQITLSSDARLLTEFYTLLNNSFFIIQQPTPSIATHTPLKENGITAMLNCKIICLLDRSDRTITVHNIIPKVCFIKPLNRTEESDRVYQQSPIEWRSYSIITTSKTRMNFSLAEFSEIVLKEPSNIPDDQKSSTRKTIHYAQCIYRIDFYIEITVRFPHLSLPYRTVIVVSSSPFGLVTNTSQATDLFAEVFIKELQMLNQPPQLHTSNNTNIPLPLSTNLTFNELIDSIERYFIYKTGIYPKEWVMTSIRQNLDAVYNNNQSSTDKQFYNLLAKILAQIDFMCEHPVLILFHEDGLFTFSDIDPMNEILRNMCIEHKKPVCAIRFGSIHNMLKSKDVGVRVDYIEKPFTNIQHYRFVEDKLSYELGLFITKIAHCEVSKAKNILSHINKIGANNYCCEFTHMDMFVKLYNSDKLKEFYTDKEKYRSIWMSFEKKDSYRSDKPNQSQTSSSTQDDGKVHNTSTSGNNYSFILRDPIKNEYHSIEQQHNDELYNPSETFLDIPLSSQTRFYNPQMNTYSNSNSNPVIIVISSSNPCAISNNDITELVSNNFPQYASAIQSNHILRVTDDPLLKLLPEPPNFCTTSQSMFPFIDQNTTCEPDVTDPTNFLEFS